MSGDPATQGPDQPAPPPAPEGAGLPPNPDPAAEAKKRQIDREVYERRTATDKRAEAELSQHTSEVGKGTGA